VHNVSGLGVSGGKGSEKFDFSTTANKTAWCCELTIFIATNQAVFATYEAETLNLDRTPLFCQTAVTCWLCFMPHLFLFCSVGSFENNFLEV